MIGQTIKLTPAQMLFLLLTLLRQLGLLPAKQKPDPDPDDGGYATIQAAQQAAHAYVNGLPPGPIDKAFLHLQIDQCCTAAAMGSMTLSLT